ncbi:MAG: threonine/serine dehydratase [Candidatus Tectomicrobia bacterium]|uniref:Threonine/serine dehydratase n=1 Tax=Tectimicrobiota bacterium TaxID=2528274 RepID=A0A932HYI2_UNCTE|nr:threonine/serine dehydratase [Candidatus Tectomicrobia bacterium]
MREPTFQDVLAARRRIAPHLRPTPFLEIPALSRRTGGRFLLKFESMQPIGAFKVRGGVNLVSALSPEERARGLITASTGNHGQSIAWAGRAFGARVLVAAPEGSNPDKIAAMRALGAEVVLKGRDFDDAREWCEAQAGERGMRYVHSANEPLLIAGVATQALEMLEEEPGLDLLLVPLGGGSGVCGSALAAKTVNPAVRVIGVQAAGAPAFHESFRAGAPRPQPSPRTFADGLATRFPYELTFQMLQRWVDDVVLVTEEEMCGAIRLLAFEARAVAEGAGAASTAAALKLDLGGKTVGAVLSGRNITGEMLRVILSGGVPPAAGG